MSNVRTLLTHIALGESPRWHDGRIWFCDWVGGDIIAAGLDGEGEVVARMSGFPSSIDWLPDGRMLVISGPQGLLRGARRMVTGHARGRDGHLQHAGWP